MRQLAVRTGPVHGGRQLLGQDLCDLIHRDIEPGGQLLDRIAAQYLFQLVGRDRQVLTVADPGFDLLAETGLLQFGDDGI
jgi:hypothetical protein